MKSKATWLVLGASSSIARAFAREVAERGHPVLLAGRDGADIQRTATDIGIRTGQKTEVLSFDALAFENHLAFVEACRKKAEHLHIFAAFADMPDQKDIEADFRLGRRAIDTTFVGAVSVLTAFAPVLEAQGAGAVIVLGSMAGERGRLRNYVYGAAKAGLHIFLQGLRARLFRSGVTVTTMKPGYIDTAMTWGQPGLFLVATPQACARACLTMAQRGQPVAYFPGFWRIIALLIRVIPEGIFKRTSF